MSNRGKWLLKRVALRVDERAGLLIVFLTLSTIFYCAYYIWGSDLFIGRVSDTVFDINNVLTEDLSAPKPDTPPFVFVDLDQRTYERLDHPAVFPKVQLAALLQRLWAAKPALMIVDVDIGAAASESEIEAMNRSLDEMAMGKVPVLFVQGAIPSSESDGTVTFRATPYDATFASSPVLQWVAARTIIGDDFIERRMDPWVVGCKGGAAVAVPGPSLAALVALRNKDQPLTGALGYALRSAFGNRPPACDAAGPSAGAEARMPDAITLSLKSGELTFRRGEPYDRIRFTFRWEQATPNLPSGSIAGGEGGTRPLYQRLSAEPYFIPEARISDDLLRDAIVIVGSSAAEARDMHLTPLRAMPGPLIIINAVRAILDFGQEQSAGFWAGLLMIDGMTIITFILWTWLDKRATGPFGEVIAAHLITLGWLAIWVFAMLFFALPVAALGMVLSQYILSILLGVTRTHKGMRHRRDRAPHEVVPP
jgi:hypothetical protein